MDNGSCIIFFAQAYKLSAYAPSKNKLGRNHNATPSTLGVRYFLVVVHNCRAAQGGRCEDRLKKRE